MRFAAIAGLKQKLVLAFLVSGAIPLIVVALIALNVSGALRDSALADQKSQAFAASDKIDRNLFERYGDVQAFAQSDPARSMDPARIQGWMDTVMATYTPIYNLMVVVDRSGRIIAANRVDLDGKKLDTRGIIGDDVANEAWFIASTKSFEKGVTYVSPLRQDAQAAKVYGADSPRAKGMTFSYPILDDSGAIIGVWANHFDANVVESILGSVVASTGRDTATAVVLDATGAVLGAAGYESKALAGGVADDPSVAKIVARGAAGAFVGRPVGRDGEAVIGFHRSQGFSTYAGLGWRVGVSVDSKQAVATANAARSRIMFAGITFVLLITIAAWLLARSFARPIVLLQREMEHVAESQDLMIRVEATRSDEIGQVARSFNRMMSHFHDIIRTVGEQSRDLRNDAQQAGFAAGESGQAAQQIAATVGTIATATRVALIVAARDVALMACSAGTRSYGRAAPDRSAC